MKKIQFTPFRPGEYSINDYTFTSGINEVPDQITSTEPYKALVESGAVKELPEPASVELESEIEPELELSPLTDPLVKPKKGSK